MLNVEFRMFNVEWRRRGSPFNIHHSTLNIQHFAFESALDSTTFMKLRFAPSPTGFLHVGGARTAIFNLLHARRYGGTMLLRIEDTDVERSKQHHAEQIVSSLQWLGVEWDEGPLYQSDRLARYRERAEELVAGGKAYRCYCTVEELEEERVAAEQEGRTWRYSGRCRMLAAQTVDAPHVIRFRVEPGTIEFHDLI